jgi:hypothetical protein
MFSLRETFSAVRRASGLVLMYRAPGLVFDGSEVPRASGALFMFYAPVLVYGGTDGIGSRFQVLHFGTRFWRRGGRRVPLSYCALPDSFLTVPRASGPVFMFCAPGHVFGDTECVGSHFHVLRSGTRFRRYRVRRVTFSCFALPKTPELVFGGT